ncbi:hypothetical protein GGR53DRAFT_477582 [Hypoxylon sp. FL1150]|nr:hypothetical protein GGR53DRAFT_477582 [Hypoxylon sp. FL1150]
MMVETRSGAGLQDQAEAQAQIPQKRPVHDISSSDDDQEDIPFVSARGSMTAPTSTPLDPRRKRFEQPSLSRPTSIGQIKRRKIEHAVDPRDVHPYPTPVSSIAAMPTQVAHEVGPRSPSVDDAVPAGLINSVNAALKQCDHEEPDRPPASPTQQLMSERDDENDQADGVEPDPEETAPQEPEDEEESLFVPDNGSEGSHVPESGVEEDREDQANQLANQNQEYLWAVPTSPPRPSPKQHDPTPSLERQPPQKRLSSQRNPKPSWFSRINEARAAEGITSSSQEEEDDDEFPVILHLGVDVDAQQDEQEEAGDDRIPEQINGVLTDDEDLGDIDLSAEESFAQDVTNFRARHPKGYQGVEVFEGPSENDDIAVHISFVDLKMVLKLMSHRAWAGLKGQWHARPFRYGQSEVGPVRTLLQFLTRLERLLDEAPRAPRITEQNLFFREHSDLLGYYFTKIGRIVNHIRKRKWEDLARSDVNTKGFDMMSSELMTYGIPMLFHSMASAWCLGGIEPLSTSFTTSSIELLMRILGWVELLYLPLLSRLRQELADSAEDKHKYQHEERLVLKKKREALEEYLKDLRRTLETSIDNLAKEEHQRDQERDYRRGNLERQKELEAQWIREEEEMMRSIEKKQWRALMSIRDVYFPLSESPIPSSATVSPMRQLPPPPRGIDSWTEEEKRFLFRAIQKSYPALPDLAVICSDIDRTFEDVEAAAKELLGLILEDVCPDYDAADRAAHIKRMMDDYRLTYGP